MAHFSLLLSLNPLFVAVPIGECSDLWYPHDYMADTFEDFLNDISRCFLEPSFNLWRSRLILPFTIVTQKGPVVLANSAALHRNFAHYLQAIEILQIDVIDRSIVSFETCEDGTILGTFQTRLVSNGMLSTDLYTATALLQRIDERLRMSSMLNGRGHHEWTGIAGDWDTE